MPKTEKVTVVEEVRKFLEESNSIFITDYSGLNVEDITILRKNLREKSVKYLVAKNTLVKIAAKDAGLENIVQFLSGPTAIAFGVDDPAIPAKILYDSYKDKEKPIIKAFVLDKELYKGSDIVRLAELPSREILLAQLIGAIESPFQALMGSVNAVMQELVATIDALAKAKG
ncbi:MAG: 50S ribosomal protein L10 [Candidatus Zixiibacteriota bacterium]